MENAELEGESSYLISVYSRSSQSQGTLPTLFSDLFLGRVESRFFHLELSIFSWLLKWFIAWRWYFAPEKIIGKWRRAGTRWVVKQFQVLNLLFQALKVWSWLRQLRQNGFRPLFWAWLFNKNQNKSCKQWYSCLKYVGLVSSLIILALSNTENIWWRTQVISD